MALPGVAASDASAAPADLLLARPPALRQSAPPSGSTDTSLLTPADPQHAHNRSGAASSSPDSSSEEEDDDPHDVAEGDPVAALARRTFDVLALPRACSQEPAAQRFAARDHSSLEPRPPRS